jgi:hypothetical protein
VFTQGHTARLLRAGTGLTCWEWKELDRSRQMIPAQKYCSGDWGANGFPGSTRARWTPAFRNLQCSQRCLWCDFHCSALVPRGQHGVDRRLVGEGPKGKRQLCTWEMITASRLGKDVNKGGK